MKAKFIVTRSMSKKLKTQTSNNIINENNLTDEGVLTCKKDD